MAMNDQQSLRIDAVDVPRHDGRIGLCACPGGRRTLVVDHDPVADLVSDLERVVAFGASGVVSLIDDRELVSLGIESLPVHLQRHGLWWKHLPITDMGIPDEQFEQHWESNSTFIRETLGRGENVVVSIALRRWGQIHECLEPGHEVGDSGCRHDIGGARRSLVSMTPARSAAREAALA